MQQYDVSYSKGSAWLVNDGDSIRIQIKALEPDPF